MKKEEFYKPGNQWNAASYIMKVESSDDWSLVAMENGNTVAGGVISDIALKLLTTEYKDLVTIDNKDIIVSYNTWEQIKIFEANYKQQLINSKKLNMNVNQYIDLNGARGLAVFDMEDKESIQGDKIKMTLYLNNTGTETIYFNPTTKKYEDENGNEISEEMKFEPFEQPSSSLYEFEEEEMEVFASRDLKQELEKELFIEILKKNGLENINIANSLIIVDIDNNKEVEIIKKLLTSVGGKLNDMGAYEIKSNFIDFKKAFLSKLNEEKPTANKGPKILK